MNDNFRLGQSIMSLSTCPRTWNLLPEWHFRSYVLSFKDPHKNGPEICFQITDSLKGKKKKYLVSFYSWSETFWRKDAIVPQMFILFIFISISHYILRFFFFSLGIYRFVRWNKLSEMKKLLLTILESVPYYSEDQKLNKLVCLI